MAILHLNILLLFISLASAGPSHNGIPGFERSVKAVAPLDVTLNDRLACLDGAPDGDQPPSRGDTTVQVDALIEELIANGYDAYVIPTSDAHQSEYTASADERRSYISGFTGSAGTVVILADGRRALWTDGRYFLQAEEQLDCQWLMMKSRSEGVPSIDEWLLANLEPNSLVVADARLLGADTWKNFNTILTAAAHTLMVEPLADGNNMVDNIWNLDGRPSYSMDPIFIHEVEFAGVDWQTKIQNIRLDMQGQGADVAVLTALDEVAWILNLRGTDIAYNPVFRSYLVIDISSGETEVLFFIPDMDVKVPDDVRAELGIDACVPGSPCVSLQDYDTIGTVLESIAGQAQLVWLPSAYDTSSGVSYYIYDLVPASKRLAYRSQILLDKATKNSVEQAGMKNAHIKDGTALVEFLAFMEEQMSLGNAWTEIEAEEALNAYRATQADYMGDSFGPISAFGANGAIIHYEATPDTDTAITNSSLYLLDSGGQYKDGTTDVTRTMHYGTPSDYQIECYTKVLQGQIDFATILFPHGTAKSYIDILARKPLFNLGLNYNHGTSHGVGMFLNVHEGSDTDFQLGFHGSDEPGYYEDGHFGIRLENVVAVVEATTKYHFTAASYGFETITIVPYEPKLIDVSQLTNEQCTYLNAYHKEVLDILGPIFEASQSTRAYDWTVNKTTPLQCV